MNPGSFKRGRKLLRIVLVGALAMWRVQAADAAVVVATDGSCNFTNVQAAANVVPVNGTQPFVIVLKPGRYAGQACCGSPVFNQFLPLGNRSRFLKLTLCGF